MAAPVNTSWTRRVLDTLSVKPSEIERKMTANFLEDGRDNRFFGLYSAIPAIATSCIMIPVHPVSGVVKGVVLISQSRFIDGTSEVATGLLRTVQSVCNVAIIFFKAVVGVVFHERVYGNAAKILADQQAAEKAQEDAKQLAEEALAAKAVSAATEPLRAELETQRKQVAGLIAELAQEKTENKNLSEKLVKATDDAKNANPQRVSYLEAEMKALKASEQAMSESLKATLDKMADLEKTAEALKTQKADASKIIDQMKKDSIAAQEEIAAAANVKNASDELIKKLRAEIEDLKKAADQVEEKA